MKIKFYQKTFQDDLYWEIPRKKVIENLNHDTQNGIVAFCILKRDGYLKSSNFEYKSILIK